MNIILIDEMTISDKPEHHRDNSMKRDWSKIDVSQPNSFLLVAFNPVGFPGKQTNFQIQTPTEKTLSQQLHVGYRSAKPIADLTNYFSEHIQSTSRSKSYL